MTGLTLPRWLGLLLRRWFPRPVSAYRRPQVRSAKPMLTLLEERFSPTSLSTTPPVDLTPPYLPGLERELSSTFMLSRQTEDSPGLTPTEAITLASSPSAQSNDDSVANQPTSTEPEMFTPSIFSQQDTEAQDTLFTQSSSRLFSPLSTPPQPLPPPAANLTGGGGSGVGGSSTPNAGGGGGGATGGGGGGPGLINANMFLGDALSASATALTAASSSIASSVSPASASGATPITAINSAAPASTSAVRSITPSVGTSPSASASPTTFQTSYSMTAPTLAGWNHFKPLPAHGFDPHKGGDPLYVLDLNTGETVPANVTLVLLSVMLAA